MMKNKTVLILSASADIGRALMRQYLQDGATVIGTYRKAGSLNEFQDHPNAVVLPLDLEQPETFEGFTNEIKKRGLSWDLFIASNGTMEPIGPFMELDGEAWQNSVASNALLPCRLLQQLYPLRNQQVETSVAFMAGGGTNNPFTNYSAYCLSKILLIKMCELLDDEVKDMKTFIIGPGYIRTKIHDETIAAGQMAGVNLQKTQEFLDGGDGTPMKDIYDCIEWCAEQPRSVISGRNISAVHDPWRNGGKDLITQLEANSDMFKLRRYGN